MRTSRHIIIALGLLLSLRAIRGSAQNQYPFQNPELPLEERVNNIVSLMTLDEKVALLSQRPGVPRLGIRSMMQVEGLHGVRAGGGATTTYPQSIGLGETWDTDILHQVGATEGHEARYLFQSPRYGRSSLVIRAPNAHMGRDIRWGRNEECYGEDPFLIRFKHVTMNGAVIENAEQLKAPGFDLGGAGRVRAVRTYET